MGKVIMRKRVELTDSDVDMLREAITQMLHLLDSDDPRGDRYANLLNELEDVTELAYYAEGLPL